MIELAEMNTMRREQDCATGKNETVRQLKEESMILVTQTWFSKPFSIGSSSLYVDSKNALKPIAVSTYLFCEPLVT